ncbi:MAG: phosphotransferase [Povalibacter sp.]
MSPDELERFLPSSALGQVRSIERIKHGLTNDSWRVITEHADLVVRRGNASELSLQIDRTSESVVLSAVADAGLGPQVVLNQLDERILVTRYAGPTWTSESALQLDNIDRLAKVFSLLHALAPPARVQHLDLEHVVSAYLATLAAHDAASNLRASALQTQATHIVESLRRESRACLCHNDVHALNVVQQDQLRLIDWEYAGVGEPFFDLASVCVYHTYDRQRRQRLLASYDGDLRDDAYRRLELSCWLFEYIRDLWMAVRELSGPTTSG